MRDLMRGAQLLLKAKYLRKGGAWVTYSCPTTSFLLALTSDLPEGQRNLNISRVEFPDVIASQH